MPTFVESLRKVADLVRSLASPTTLAGGKGLGVWQNEVDVVVRTWPGKPGLGTPSDTVLRIVPRPEITEVSPREIATSGGLLRQGDLRLTNLTPAYPGGGYTMEQLAPTAPANAQQRVGVFYVLTGPNAGEYMRVGALVGDAFGYVLTLRRKNATP